MTPPPRILILCTGNSCRSQMAEGFLRSFDSRLDVHSAGTHPASRVHPRALAAMSEAGIDLTGAAPKPVERFLDQPFDYVITVCGGARETCPAFTGNVGRRLHIGFDDPAEAVGSDAEVTAVFRRVREEIRRGFRELYERELRPAMEG